VSLSQTLLLGFIAGATILLGLPLGRLNAPAPSLRVFLNAAATGILVFILWDVLSAAWEPIDSDLSALHEGGAFAPVLGYGLLFAAGLAVGLLGLVAYETWMQRRAKRPAPPFGPGAMSADEVTEREGRRVFRSAGRRLALLIAVGIGLHNFAEGLAIGQSAAQGEIALATMLVIGFGLHNATEGFGIVAPLAADVEAGRPSWALLGLLGLIGGGPTFIGAGSRVHPLRRRTAHRRRRQGASLRHIRHRAAHRPVGRIRHGRRGHRRRRLIGRESLFGGRSRSPPLLGGIE
jgi:ZIP family zinc transporter